MGLRAGRKTSGTEFLSQTKRAERMRSKEKRYKTQAKQGFEPWTFGL